MAYCLSGGPWNKQWVRLGYDPRIDIQAKAFQTIDFRVPAELAASFPQGRLPAKMSRFSRQQEGEHDATRNSKGMTREELAGWRSFRCVPKAQSTFYTLCELEDPKMKQLLASAKTLDQVSEKSGWYEEDTLSQLRQLMKDKLKQMLGEVGSSGEAAREKRNDREQDLQASHLQVEEHELSEEEHEWNPEETGHQVDSDEMDDEAESAMKLLESYAPTAQLAYGDDDDDCFDILDDI